MRRLMHRAGWGVSGAVAIALVASLAGVIWAGPLDPPAAPGSTGPTHIYNLGGVGLTLGTSGTYVVEAPLTGTAGHSGILVTGQDVTLDLNGFALVGPGGAGTEVGITAVLPGGHFTLRNGTVRGWGGGGLVSHVSGEFDHLTFDQDGLNRTSDQGAGVELTNANISNCTVEHSGGAGAPSGGVAIYLDSSTMSSCVVADNNSAAYGVWASNSSLTGVSSRGNKVGITTLESTVTRSTVVANSGDGIQAGSQSTIADNDVSSNGGHGIRAWAYNRISGNTASQNTGDGINVSSGGNAVSGNNVSSNGGSGIHVVIAAGNRIADNNSFANVGRGIWLDGGASKNSVVNNSASNNGMEGILVYPGGQGNLIDGNHVSSNVNNIAIDNLTPGQVPNVITRNWAVGAAGANYSIGANNDAAPVTTAAAVVSPMGNVAQ